LLQNCHLGLEFMEELLEFVLTCEDPNPTMRIWITVEPHPEFSITLLQSAIKFTNEPPQGVRAGLKRSFSEYDQDYLDISNLAEWKPLIYAVAFTHTTVQERRKFGPIGWNIPYEFNSSDQSATMQFIQNHLDDLDPKRGIQWSTVRYMIGEVNYGGRVTDDFDKRLLNTYTLVWFSPNTFSDKFNFYKGYTIPRYTTHDQVMEAIEEMSLTDSPEAFGLHPNADITYQTRAGGDVLATIVDIQPKDSAGGGGETREEKVYRMADEMLEKLPDGYVPHEVQARMKKMGEYSSLNIFLRQEIDRMNRVLTCVRLTLSDLKLAIDGTIIMSENLRDALDNMFDARVPNNWKKISWEASTLGFWFSELQDRDVQFRDWCFNGRPKSFWMTGFFNPQGFLTAMRQEVTRMHKGWALDSVTLANDVTKNNYEDIANGPAEGVFVHGLFLDGANWDRKNNRLCDPLPKVLNVQMPILHIYAINSTAPKDPALYTCPCYKKPRRTDLTFISPLWLKTNQHTSRWVLRGVALLCDIK
jgi:dynein heavy chain